MNDPSFDKLDHSNIPDIIIVKKYYGDRSARRRTRMWKLKHLAQEDTELDTGNMYNLYYFLVISFV